MAKNKKIYFVIGNFGISMGVNSIVMYMIPFLNTYFNTAISGLILGLGWISGGILQPLSGILSDCTYSKWGRRKPYVVVFGILSGVLAMLFSHYKSPSAILFFILMFYLTFNMYQIPLNAMIPDNVNPRYNGEIAGFWNLMGGLGALLVPLVGGTLWKYDEGLIFRITGVIIILTSLIPAIEIQERACIKSYFSLEVLSKYLYNSQITKFYAAKILWWMAIDFIMPYLTIYLTKSLSFGIESASILMTVFILCNIVSSPYLGKIADKCSRKYILIFFLILFAAINVILVRVNYLPSLFILMSLMGICYSSMLVMPFAILVGIAQKGHEGFYLGMDNVFMYIPRSFASIASGFVAEYLGYKSIFELSSVFAIASVIVIFLFWDD